MGRGVMILGHHRNLHFCWLENWTSPRKENEGHSAEKRPLYCRMLTLKLQKWRNLAPEESDQSVKLFASALRTPTGRSGVELNIHYN